MMTLCASLGFIHFTSVVFLDFGFITKHPLLHLSHVRDGTNGMRSVDDSLL